MMCRLDRRRPRGAKHRLCAARGIKSAGKPAVQEGEELLHDLMENNAATERGPLNRVERRGLVEFSRVELKRIACLSLQACDELLLEFDGLKHRVNVAVARKLGVMRC